MIRESGIQFDEIDPEAPDMPFSISSGAGVIFGVTGGVTEAACAALYRRKAPRRFVTSNSPVSAVWKA